MQERGKRVVVGGPYVSTCVEPLNNVDHIFIGEAETTLPEFISDFERGEARPVYQAPEKPSLAMTPVPDFRLADLKRYFAMPVQYSRGCPFQCEFCDIIERTPRTKNHEQLLAELDALYDAGWRGLVFERQIRFIRESAIPLAMVGLLTALPDTQLWRRLGLEGRLLGESTSNTTDCSLNFIPKMDATLLVEGYKKILRTIYSPSEYYRRALSSLDRAAQNASEAQGQGFIPNLTALARLIFVLGVRDPARREFWRYLREAFAAHPDRLDDVILLAALGYHFRKLTEIYCD